MRILVTGGAGYIGFITALELKNQGHSVTILDNLERSEADRVQGFDFVKGSTADRAVVEKILEEKQIEAVIHFAAWIEAGESMKNPGSFFENNSCGTLQLLEAMVAKGVKNLVFSSTAAVYGIPNAVPIPETAELKPVNAYGESKLIVERMLRWYDQIHGLRAVNLRYFNAAGALLDGSYGEDHKPETHLIPNIIKAAMEGHPVKLFGTDYPNPDGTCIRDYIHVQDLASAHIVALQALTHGHASDTYNVGTGNGYSNREVIQMVEQVSGHSIQIQEEPRRPGDPDQLIADSTKLQTELGWKPQYSDLRTIVESAWKWHSQSKD